MKRVKAKEFDEAFKLGKSVIKHVDASKARRVNEELKRVNINFPAWVIASLDREARRLGISKQALVKIWVVEKLKKSCNS